MTISESIRYVGVIDRETDLFEGQYPVPDGIRYNSYVILDDEIAVMDSVDTRFADLWLAQINTVTGGKAPDYLIVQHMESDHSGSIMRFAKAYPEAKIVSSARAFPMIKNFFGTDFADKAVTVGEGDTLSLGGHTLQFITAPMVHWPEVIMTYETKEHVLFTADAFGTFGRDETGEKWIDEARRYYIGIVGKFGSAVQAVLKKIADLEIATICPLHGPVLTEDLDNYLDLSQIWSTYTPEEEGVLIAYTSVYGNTERAVRLLANALRDRGCSRVIVHDLARCDMTRAVADAFRMSKLVLATTTYNGGVFPFMQTFIHYLTGRTFCSRTVAFMENGSWAPTAAKVMGDLLAQSKNLTFAETSVRITSALNKDSTAQLLALADELTAENQPC